MRIYIELSNKVDVALWGKKHSDGLAGDPVPYGLHHLARSGDVVRYRPTMWSPTVRDVVRRLDGRTWGWEFAREAVGRLDPARRSADVVLGMDERTGAPAALLGGPPVVSGVAWLERARALGSLQRAAARRALQACAGVFTECPALVPTLVEEFDLDPTRVHAIRLGIDTEFFASQPWPERPGGVFSVGDDRMRDHSTLVRAMRLVRRRLPQARLELATTLPVDLPPQMGRVFRKRMDHAVRQRYADAEVIAVALRPTRQGSGLTVLLEAMSSGRPVVVTDNPGLERYVSHGETGLLVPPGDEDAMARAIVTLLGDPDGAREMGRRARAAVESQFTSRDMAHDLRALLDHLG